MRKFYGIAGAALLLLAGCADDNQEPDPGPDPNLDWVDENSVAHYCDAFYDVFAGYGNGTEEGDYYFKTLSDNQAAAGLVDWKYKTVPSTAPEWNREWTAIRRANLLLEKIDGVPMEEERRVHWRAVGRLMRGWHYYRLVRMYGDVPWTERSAAVSADGYPLEGDRTDRDLVMDKVLEDLDHACAKAEENDSKTTFNRNVAHAMKAEACLWEGSFRMYRVEADGQKLRDPSGAVAYYKEVLNACTYIKEQGYRLNDSYRGNYNSVDLSDNPEMIFYKAYDKSGKRHSLIAATSSTVPMAGMSKDAFEAFLFIRDARPLTVTSQPDISDTPARLGTADAPVFSINQKLKLRDNRLTQTIDTAQCFTGYPFIRFASGQPMTSSTGYGICKYDNPDLSEADRNVPGANYTDAPLFWLSVVHLQYAEVCAELTRIGAKDPLDSDLAGLNEVRARGLLPALKLSPGFSDPKNTIGISDLMWEIRRERRCELMFDNDTRYWDLVRWHLLDKLDSRNNPDIVLGANVSAAMPANMSGDYLDTSGGKVRIYDKKYYLYPIPSDQFARTPGWKQNPGW